MPRKRTAKKKVTPEQRIKRVALLLESDMAFDRGIARGVGKFLRSNTGWIILMDPIMEVSLENIRHWKPDGIITSIRLPAIEEIAKIEDIPMVGFGSYSRATDSHFKFPIVSSNQRAIGKIAAQHFMNNGMRRFAFCGGDEQAEWCDKRRDGFIEELAKNDYSCKVYEPDLATPTSMPDAIRSLSNWLKDLPKPTGIFVFFDGWARWVLDACVVQNIQVPQEISVIGVDNDRWLCELSQPMLSSVDANLGNTGYTLAKILDGMMSNDLEPPALTEIDPAQVESRASSNFMDFDDPEVAFALRYIKEHACDPISTADVLKVTGMSNSTAYRKFMKAIGRSIHNEIQRIQMDRVKELLTTTNLSVNAIAQSAGFENVRYLTQVFRDLTKQTPTEYRRTQSTPDVQG